MLAPWALCCILGACTQGTPVFDPDAGGRDAATPPPDAGPSYRVFFDDGLGPDVVRRFAEAGHNPVSPPSIVYPEDGVLLPPNLRGIDFHFRPNGYQIFEFELSQRGEPAVLAYVWCAPIGSGCTFQPWREIWEELARRRSSGPFEVRIRGLVGDLASARSEPIHIELADEEIVGGIYFWSTDPPSIRRYEFGLERRSSELFLSGAEEGGCVGCHSLSRDGTRIAVGFEGTNGSFDVKLYDVATRMPVVDAPFPGEIVSYGPSGEMLASGAFADMPLRILSGEDGSLIRDLGIAGRAADWSPDGKLIVYGAFADLGGSELHLIRQEGGEWSAPRVLPTPTTQNELHPAFAPDSNWVLFTATEATDFTRPVLAALHIEDEMLVRLRRAAGDNDDLAWARWNPNPYVHRGRRIFWLTFSSRRDFGLIPGESRQIWMAAFDPEADPNDPSRPAFRIPAQVLGVSNLIAQWVIGVPRKPCDVDDDCPSDEECVDGFCYPKGPQ
jgi:TolB protein